MTWAMPNATVTERAAIMRERAAFILGAETCPHSSVVAERAAKTYPIPTRPRIVVDIGGHHEWKCEGGLLYWRNVPAGPWFPLTDETTIGQYTIRYPRSERVKIWADLLANPTEEVV